MMQTRSTSRVIPITSKELQSNENFGRVPEMKMPESGNSGMSINPRDLQSKSEKMDSDNPILSDASNFYKKNGAFVTPSSNYLKLNRCEAALWLMAKHPFAYLLLNLVAIRAQRIPNHPSGLEIGESFVGDYESIGATRQQYRTALGVLTRMKYLTISETCRTRKKSTTGVTTVGTKVKLLNSDIWDINPESSNHSINHRPTTDQPPTNHDQEELSISNISSTMSDSQAHQTKVKERIFFDWELNKLQGIEQSDIDTWKETFTHVDVVEYLKFIEQDIAAKPTRYKKRKQILKTVLIYFSNKNENNQAQEKIQKNKGFQKPESLHNKSFNKDTSPKKYNNTYDFSQR